MAFLFIWQFILSGPLEIASGFIGFRQYLGYVWPSMTELQGKLVVVALGVTTIFLLYRRIGSIGKITVILWVGTLADNGRGDRDGRPQFRSESGLCAERADVGFWLGISVGSRRRVASRRI